MRWDLFCRVVDNHGDVGVCWRLAAELAARGESVRLWIDDAGALAWMAPGGHPGVTVIPWRDPLPAVEPGDVVVEAFGCDPPEAMVAAMAARLRAGGPRTAWINLEYLSAESYVERSHRLPSPVFHGPGAGLTKYFFYPGFTAGTGGLLRERDLAGRQAAFDRGAWLGQWGIAAADSLVVTLFCYEPPALADLLRHLPWEHHNVRLLVTAGRAAAAVRGLLPALDRSHPGWNAAGRLQPVFLPLLSQRDFDHLLWAGDLNFVRGEDSLVRALLAGRPFVWQLYPQSDDAHWPKLQAFLERLDVPGDLEMVFRTWNGDPVGLPPFELPLWSMWARGAADQAWALPELAAELASFARERLE